MHLINLEIGQNIIEHSDGAYDRHQIYDAIAEHQSSAAVDIIIPPLESSKISEDPKIELTQRDKHI